MKGRGARGVRKPGGAGKPDIIADRAGAAGRRGEAMIGPVFFERQPLKRERLAVILFALMAYRQNQRHIGACVIAEKRQVA